MILVIEDGQNSETNCSVSSEASLWHFSHKNGLLFHFRAPVHFIPQPRYRPCGYLYISGLKLKHDVEKVYTAKSQNRWREVFCSMKALLPIQVQNPRGKLKIPFLGNVIIFERAKVTLLSSSHFCRALLI
jgi:hypothetical protein